MTDVFILCSEPRLCRILELECLRLGLSVTLKAPSEEPCRLCIWDTDTGIEPPATMPLLALGDPQSDTMSHRITAHLPKPLLLSDLRAALRSLSQPQPPSTVKASRTVHRSRRNAGPTLLVDHNKKTATVGNGQPVSLSQTEYRILCRLIDSSPHPLSPQEAADILGEDKSNKFNVYICYLRRKLEQGNLRLIRTVRGKGYILDIPIAGEERN